MNFQSGFTKETCAKIKRAWLLTWEWADDLIGIKDKFVAVISSRYSDNSIKKILEQLYVSGWLSLNEQFAFVKSKKHSTFKVENSTIAVSEKLQKKASLPPKVPFAESIRIGINPWLWARIVYDLETWMDENNVEYLKWKELENISWDGGEIRSERAERFLKR